jgi:hypothetical protein
VAKLVEQLGGNDEDLLFGYCRHWGILSLEGKQGRHYTMRGPNC